MCLQELACSYPKSQFYQETFNRPTNHSLLLIGYNHPHTLLEHYALFHDQNLEGEPPVHEDVKINALVRYKTPIGPVNGLFYVDSVENNFVALWNPATGELSHPPNLQPELPAPYPLDGHKCNIGFGYSNNEYKIICLRALGVIDADVPYHVGVEAIICNVIHGSWRFHDPITVLDTMPHRSLCNTHINRVYYWVKRDVFKWMLMLVSFDMESEVFQETPIGLEPNFNFLKSEFIALYNDDTLALIVSDLLLFQQGKHEIWLMKEQACWEKHLSIGPHLPRELLLPVGFWRSNKMVFENSFSRELLAYNTETFEKKYLGIQEGIRGSPLLIYRYKESLYNGTNEADE